MRSIFLLSLLLYSQLGNAKNKMNQCYVPARYVVLAEQMIADMANKLSKKHQMCVIGTGGGLADCVNVLCLSFQIKGPLTQEKLREVLIDCEEEFLYTVNSNVEIRPHLKNYPFTTNEIDIAIFVVDPSRREVYHPNIGVVYIKRNNIVYKTTDPSDPFKYKSEIRENYDEALKIVKRSKS